MKEPDFDSSSLEEPGTELREEELTPEVGEGGPPPEEEEPAEGSTLEQHPDALYIKTDSVRRRPKYATFGALGGLIGLILGLVLAQTGAIPADQDYSRLDLTIVLVGLGIPAGILVGLLVALLLDRRRK